MSSKSQQQQQQHHHHHATTKLKPPPRLLFSCAMFRNCTQTVLSPTGTTTAVPPLPSSSSSSGGGAVDTPPGTVPPRSPPPASPPPPPSPPPIQQPPPHPSPPPKFVPQRPAEVDPPPASSSSSSSSSSASHSFTLWRFPLHHTHSDSQYLHPSAPDPPDAAYHKSCNSKNPSRDLEEAFKAADRYFACGSCLPALRLLERSLAAHDPAAAPCPREVMAGVVASVLDPSTARPAAKVLLALLLAEENRRPAVEAGAAAAALSAVANAASGASGTAAAERALAALELMCTVPEGAVEVRVRPEAATVLAGAAGRMSGRGRECGLGVLASLYGGEWAADAPEEVGRAVVAAMQGECSARGRRKGAQLLKALQEAGRLAGVVEDGC